MNANHRLTGLIEAFVHPIDPETTPSPFSPEQWKQLDGFLTPIALTESTILYHRNSDEKGIFLLESGRAAIHYENSEGKLRICLISPGNIFGEASFLGKLPRQATAQATADGKAWILDRIKFKEMTTRNPELAVTFMQFATQILSKRVFNGRRRIGIS